MQSTRSASSFVQSCRPDVPCSETPQPRLSFAVAAMRSRPCLRRRTARQHRCMLFSCVQFMANSVLTYQDVFLQAAARLSGAIADCASDDNGAEELFGNAYAGSFANMSTITLPFCNHKIKGVLAYFSEIINIAILELIKNAQVS